MDPTQILTDTQTDLIISMDVRPAVETDITGSLLQSLEIIRPGPSPVSEQPRRSLDKNEEEEQPQVEIPKKKKRRPQTAEEKARRNAKLQAIRDARTPEEIERENEKRRKRLGQLPRWKGLSLTKEEVNKRRAERRMLSRDEMIYDPDPERDKEFRNARSLRHLNNKAKMTEEEQEELRTKKYFWNLANKASMTQEEKEDYARRRREYQKKFYQNNEEKYRRHLAYIRNWLNNNYKRMKEEDPEKFRANARKNYQKRKEAMKTWSEEEISQQRIRYRIAQRKKKLKLEKERECWSEEEHKRRVADMETNLWKELYPDGKPPPKKPRPSTRVLMDPSEMIPDDQFTCLKCVPKWDYDQNRWKPLGFKTKIQLLRHVRFRHKRFYFACSHCEILKYSEFSLNIHLKVCPAAKRSLC